jgi:hypothetical protein
MKKMALESTQCREFGHTEVKKSLPQIAHLCCRKSRFIAIGKPALGLKAM